MLIIGIDPGITGSICFFEDGKIIDVVEMPNMAEGKKNKKQVNGAQIYHEISLRIQHLKEEILKTKSMHHHGYYHLTRPVNFKILFLQ